MLKYTIMQDEYATSSKVNEIKENITDAQLEIRKLRSDCYTLVEATQKGLEIKIDDINTELNDYKEYVHEKMKYIKLGIACLSFGLLCAGVSLICICLALS